MVNPYTRIDELTIHDESHPHLILQSTAHNDEVRVRHIGFEVYLNISRRYTMKMSFLAFGSWLPYES